METKEVVEQLIMWQLKHGYITKMNVIKMMKHMQKEAKQKEVKENE